MSKHTHKPIALAFGAALVGGLALSGSAFAMTDLASGYLLGAQHASPGEGSCGGDKAKGEGGCGMAKKDTDKDGKISKAEFAAAHKGDASKFDAHDANKDGFIDDAEMKAHHEGKCGEGKCGGDKKKADMKAGDKKAHAEGKCGEGACGGSV